MQQNVNTQPYTLENVISDVYYMLFRQKWKIILMGILGLVVAAGLWKISRSAYESEARLLVRYVADSIATGPTGAGSQISTPDRSGRNIINSEIQILTSRNLIEHIVREMGHDSFDMKLPGGNEPTASQTAAMAAQMLRIEVPRRSNIIRVSFQAYTPTVAQQFLERLIAGYLEKHLAIHRDAGVYDFLSQQTDQLRLRLTETEDDLKDLRTAKSITSIEESRGTVLARIEQLNQELINAETEFAAANARVKLLRMAVAAPANEQPAAAVVGVECSASLAGLLEGLRSLRQKEIQLRGTYTDDSTLVRHVRAQIVETRAQIEDLYALDKGTNTVGVSMLTPDLAGSAADGSAARGSFLASLQAEEANLASLAARIEVLNGHVGTATARARDIEEAEGEFTRLMRQKEMTEETYRYFTEGLEHA